MTTYNADQFIGEFGMTLRDWFAGHALQAILIQLSPEALGKIATYEDISGEEVAARYAYIFANAMIKERGQP